MPTEASARLCYSESKFALAVIWEEHTPLSSSKHHRRAERRRGGRSQYIQVLAVGGQGKPPGIDHGGRYEDVYVRTAEGWRIKTRKDVRTVPPE